MTGAFLLSSRYVTKNTTANYYQKSKLIGLQNVIRDLWALRLEGFSSKINANMSETETEEPEVFSSQAADTEDESDKAFKPSGKRVQWPRLVDSFALCYMGALLMRLPIGIADFHR